jgi:hypothetical protein
VEAGCFLEEERPKRQRYTIKCALLDPLLCLLSIVVVVVVVVIDDVWRRLMYTMLMRGKQMLLMHLLANSLV